MEPVSYRPQASTLPFTSKPQDIAHMSTLNRTTWFAAKQGDVATLKQLVEVEGHRFDELDVELKTPFYYGCTLDRPHVLHYLHKLYIAFNVVMPEDQHARCTVSCRKDDVRLYLEGKATIESVIAKRDKAARDAALSVWDAAVEGNVGCLRMWLKKAGPAALMQAHPVTGRTPLYEASHANHAAASAFLRQMYIQHYEAETGKPCQEHMDECHLTITSDLMHQILDGKMSMQDVFQLNKAKSSTK
ncbi:Aste57867_13919 [Aphanomyces stellatus]|uniref:Aste57867_13919 protein n=1 Tax=Aphanomyces stellatus TaxID=120398 RepID=A0A485KZB9_9STRA|nr:hypothetical protein As57867_013868 [Aphanomyces stellatus]VFT90749.1 Aste57867_13919 [Aphanomyces stellatus]